MIMRANESSRLSLRMLVGIVLLGLIVLPGWTLGQVKKPSKTEPANPDKQVQELERKLQSALKQLESLRKPAPPVALDLGLPVVEVNESNTGSIRWVVDNSDPKSDRGKKLQEIEAKVQALLKEVQALRGSKTNRPEQFMLYTDLTNSGIFDLVIANQTPQKPVEVTLSRTTYKLPAAKAEALGKLLQQHVKAKVMETKIEGDTLTVTTTPEVQQGIRQFIALMEGKAPPHQRQPQNK